MVTISAFSPSPRSGRSSTRSETKPRKPAPMQTRISRTNGEWIPHAVSIFHEKTAPRM